ncbi:MAG: enoyl-CoA hydratase/isomerase family protein [Hyphomonas sp.]
MSNFVLFNLDDKVGEIVLNRPQAGNSISPEVIQDFCTAIDAAISSQARTFLVRAEGDNFSFGGDVHHLISSGDKLSSELNAMANATHSGLIKLYNSRQPIVCAAQGNIIGGGLGISLCSDFLLIADNAKLSTGYSRLGLSADAGVSYFLTQAVGRRRANALLISSKFISAQEAVDFGIAESQHASDALLQNARVMAKQLSAGSNDAFMAIRDLTTAALKNDYASHLAMETDKIVDLAKAPGKAQEIAAALSKKK